MSQVSSPTVNHQLFEMGFRNGNAISILINLGFRNVTGFITYCEPPIVLSKCHRFHHLLWTTRCVNLEMLVPTVRDLGSQMFVTQDTQDSWVLKICSKRVNCCSFVCTERWKDTYRCDLSLSTMTMLHSKQNFDKCITLTLKLEAFGTFCDQNLWFAEGICSETIA